MESRFFLGQKVTLPSVGNVRHTMLARSLDDHATIGILLCDKVVLYSDLCRGNGVMLDRPHVWQSVTMTLPVQAKVTIVDLDRKPAAKIAGHYQLDLDILAHMHE